MSPRSTAGDAKHVGALHFVVSSRHFYGCMQGIGEAYTAIIQHARAS